LNPEALDSYKIIYNLMGVAVPNEHISMIAHPVDGSEIHWKSWQPKRTCLPPPGRDRCFTVVGAVTIRKFTVKGSESRLFEHLYCLTTFQSEHGIDAFG
jgi:hypothetical protein